MVGLNIITVIYYFTNNRNGLRNGQILFSEHQNGSEKKKKNLLDSRSLSKTEFISSFLFTPEVELGVFDVFSRVSSKTVLLFPTDVFRKNESEKDGKRSLQR